MAYIISTLAYMKSAKPQNAIYQLENLLELIKQKQTSRNLMFEIIPDMAYVYTLLAQNYHNLNKSNGAIANYKNAIQHGSKFYDTYSGLADVMFNQNQYQTALLSLPSSK